MLQSHALKAVLLVRSSPLKEVIVCCDFDGVITDPVVMHEPPSWYIRGHPEPAPPAKGAKEFLHHLVTQGYEVVINSARFDVSWQRDAPWALNKLDSEIVTFHIEIITTFMHRHELPFDRISVVKPLANFYIDDRAYNPILTSWQEILNIITKL